VTSSWFFLSTLNYDARSTTHQIYFQVPEANYDLVLHCNRRENFSYLANHFFTVSSIKLPIPVIKVNETHSFSNLFDKTFYMFWTGPLSIIRSQDHASRQPTELPRQIPTTCIQCCDTPDDGQWIYPKHVEYFTK